MNEIEINLLVGGPVCEWPPTLFEGDQKNKKWVGADRGALYLSERGIKPEFVIGDFDSATMEEKQAIKDTCAEIITAKPEKDDTDTELAVKEIIRRYTSCKINIYGATGGRLDHLLANLFFVLREPFYKKLQKIRLYDKQNTVCFFTPGNYQLKKETDKRYLAFVLLTAVTELSLYDEKYRLDKKSFSFPVSLASNEFEGPTATFSFKKGVICVIQSKD
ncbi:thiamine pyrophosphokinase [Liquorilactobacillus capillatus DSM 19910]|uniref:Thiamine diphosphokinase n=2 Tax=Liquorilactobacillus capillatus TaxID=480931 RepID=A0A0R1LYR4_9LACO|nr:thiamine pyrophosphokinase [Liquorilactobacillus capillatus DSM 19910]